MFSAIRKSLPSIAAPGRRNSNNLLADIHSLMMLTWKHDSQSTPWPPPFESKVDIFYHRTLGWQLHIADLISNGGTPLGSQTQIPAVPHSGFAVLQICLSYFETIGQCQQINPATTQSNEYFKEGVRAVFPELIAADAT